MRLTIALLAATAALSAAGAASAASVEVKDAVARVTVIPENRRDIKVEIIHPNARLPLEVRSRGDRVIVDGDLDRKIRSCRGKGRAVEVRGVGSVGWRDMPQVVIRTPRDAKVEAGGAVFGSVGRSASLTLSNAGCGEWTVANVEGQLRLRQAGSGDTRAGSAGSAEVRVAGSGDVAMADVRHGLEVSIAGSGSVAVRSVQGPLNVSVAGSGDVNVAGGRASAMSVSIAGSGDVNFRGVAESLKARIAGSGDVRVQEVRGEVSKTVMGSGGVTIGGA